MVRFNTVYCAECDQRVKIRGFRADDDGDTLLLYDCDWCHYEDGIAVYPLQSTVDDIKSYNSEIGAVDEENGEVEEFREWMEEHNFPDPNGGDDGSS